MTPSELSDLMLEHLDKLEKEKEIKKEREASFAPPGGLGRLPSVPTASAKIFIWDENLKGIGYNDFHKIWGERKLEDNWRRSMKSKINNLDDEASSIINSEEEVSIEYLISQLPCKDTIKMDSIKLQTLKALFEIGILHHYQIILSLIHI